MIYDIGHIIVVRRKSNTSGQQPELCKKEILAMKNQIKNNLLFTLVLNCGLATILTLWVNVADAAITVVAVSPKTFMLQLKSLPSTDF